MLSPCWERERLWEKQTAGKKAECSCDLLVPLSSHPLLPFAQTQYLSWVYVLDSEWAGWKVKEASCSLSTQKVFLVKCYRLQTKTTINPPPSLFFCVASRFFPPSPSTKNSVGGKHIVSVLRVSESCTLSGRDQGSKKKKERKEKKSIQAWERWHSVCRRCGRLRIVSYFSYDVLCDIGALAKRKAEKQGRLLGKVGEAERGRAGGTNKSESGKWKGWFDLQPCCNPLQGVQGEERRVCEVTPNVCPRWKKERHLSVNHAGDLMLGGRICSIAGRVLSSFQGRKWWLPCRRNDRTLRLSYLSLKALYQNGHQQVEEDIVAEGH